MIANKPFLLKRLFAVSFLMILFLISAMLLGLSIGSTGSEFKAVFKSLIEQRITNSITATIIWDIRFPRILLAALVGAALSLGGLVFQVLLRNPLAEPYILGISGGSAVGAIIGILMGLSHFPGVGFAAFAGSLTTLFLIIVMSSKQAILKKDSLLLSGVMINAFCSAIIMFLISTYQHSRLHNILFWLMGNLSMTDIRQITILASILFPCFLVIFWFSHSMNLLLMGQTMARTMGVNIRFVTMTLLVVTSFMVSATVSYCGLLGFVGLVIPHILRLILGSDNRVLVPSCVFGGGAYMILCDLLARAIPEYGEIPAGVITAMIGAPLFILLLKRSSR